MITSKNVIIHSRFKVTMQCKQIILVLVFDGGKFNKIIHIKP